MCEISEGLERSPLTYLPQESLRGLLSKNKKIRTGRMLPELLQKSSLFQLLYLIDLDLAKETRHKGCQHCNGPLHQANYPRQPRGLLDNLPDELLTCFSLCCGKKGCRLRTKPPSCRFMGRKVYWRVVILVVMTLKQNRPDSPKTRKLIEMLEVSPQTLKRWAEYFRDIYPNSPQWQRLAGKFLPLERNIELPSGLVNHFLSRFKSPNYRLFECLNFLSLW